MSTINDGGPAFPFTELDASGAVYHQHMGMTLRDYFAAKAMHAIMSTPKPEPVGGSAGLATMAYQMADAMLKARDEGGEA